MKNSKEYCKLFLVKYNDEYHRDPTVPSNATGENHGVFLDFSTGWIMMNPRTLRSVWLRLTEFRQIRLEHFPGRLQGTAIGSTGFRTGFMQAPVPVQMRAA